MFKKHKIPKVGDRAKKMKNATNFNVIGEENYALFPRSEFYYRFNGTSLFEMSNPDYWSKYWRNIVIGEDGDRISAILNRKNSNYRDVEYIVGSNGTTLNPFELDDYKQIFDSKNEGRQTTIKSLRNSCVYDELLQYKLSISQMIVRKFEETTNMERRNLKAYCENDYPCVLVKVMDIDDLKLPSSSEFGSLYRIVMAYFTGIIDYLAYTNRIPIEIVLRASFAHNIPSLADAGTSFRINIGMIPEVYAIKVFVAGLAILNSELPTLFKTKLNIPLGDLRKINENIDRYNNKNRDKIAVEEWSETDTVLQLLCKNGDSSGEKVSFQLARKKRKDADLLANYVLEELLCTNGKADFIVPLKKMLMHLDFGDDVLVNVKGNDIYNRPKRDFEEKEDEDIRNDDAFWRILRKISSVFETRNISILSKAVNNKTLLGLYYLLDEANVQFIKQCADEGYDSDSDCEGSFRMTDRTITCYHKKITVATGQRAINLAHFLLLYRTGSKLFDTNLMYFETPDMIKKFSIITKLRGLPFCGNYQESVRYIDLNHCNASSNSRKIDLESFLLEVRRNNEKEIIVFDYTTAKTDQINTAIKLFIPHVKVLLFVGSGLKNEQLGADTNPYGTVRIVSSDATVVKALYDVLKVVSNGNDEIPKPSHSMRKAYANIGATVTSEGIFNKSGWKFKKIEENSDKEKSSDARTTNKDFDIWIKIYILFFSGEYDNVLRVLSEILQRDINEIFSWSFDKMKYLASNKVLKLMAHGVSIDDIQKQYDAATSQRVKENKKLGNGVSILCTTNLSCQ